MDSDSFLSERFEKELGGDDADMPPYTPFWPPEPRNPRVLEHDKTFSNPVWALEFLGLWC
jgi:hypothetical protein